MTSSAASHCSERGHGAWTMERIERAAPAPGSRDATRVAWHRVWRARPEFTCTVRCDYCLLFRRFEI